MSTRRGNAGTDASQSSSASRSGSAGGHGNTAAGANAGANASQNGSSSQLGDVNASASQNGSSSRSGGSSANASAGSSRRAASAPAGADASRRHKDDGPCPIMRECGGCETLNLPYRKQIARKQQQMEELFCPIIEKFGWDAQVGDIVPMGALPGEPPDANGRLASPRAFRYKAATPFAPGSRGQVQSGLYAKGTHEIVHCSNCPVEAPGARRILNETARAATRLHIAAYSESRQSGILRHAVVRMGWKTRDAMLTVVTSQRNLPRADELVQALQKISPRIVSIAQNINPRRTNAIYGGETRILSGEPCMHDELLGCTFEISPTSFYQTNPAQTEELYRLAIQDMALEDGDTLLDAYCGSGTIGICAAKDAVERDLVVQVLGVERNHDGVDDARRNARINDLLDECHFACNDATAYMERAASQGKRVDVVSLDPPRAGATPEFLAATCALGPRRIVYISCNPATQARDIELLGESGYRLVRITPVDMFPHTSHVETVALLAREA